MKWQLLWCFPLGVFAVEPLPKSDPAKVGMSGEALAKIGPAVESLIATRKLAGGSVLVLRKGQIVYQESFGHRDIESEKPMEKDTLFRIYSMTKGLTSAAALMLCEEGKLSLDDPIDLYLKELKGQEHWVSLGKTTALRRKTTVRDLLRHTSGFPPTRGGQVLNLRYRKAGVMNRKLPLMNTVEALKGMPLLDEPGSRWLYGMSSDMLAAVVTRAAGEPFENFLHRRLIEPLGMRDTAYSVPGDKADRLATSYRRELKGLKVLETAAESKYLKDPAFKGGGSGLVSTITDYGRFLQMIANGGEFQGKRYLREGTVNLMRTNQLPLSIPQISFGKEQRFGTGFGLGFCVRFGHDDRWDKDAAIGEYGWGGAASTHYWISPKHELVVVTMEQTMPYNWNMEKTLKPLIYAAVGKSEKE